MKVKLYPNIEFCCGMMELACGQDSEYWMPIELSETGLYLFKHTYDHDGDLETLKMKCRKIGDIRINYCPYCGHKIEYINKEDK